MLDNSTNFNHSLASAKKEELRAKLRPGAVANGVLIGGLAIFAQAFAPYQSAIWSFCLVQFALTCLRLFVLADGAWLARKGGDALWLKTYCFFPIVFGFLWGIGAAAAIFGFGLLSVPTILSLLICASIATAAATHWSTYPWLARSYIALTIGIPALALLSLQSWESAGFAAFFATRILTLFRTAKDSEKLFIDFQKQKFDLMTGENARIEDASTFRSVIDSLEDAVYLKDLTGKFILSNKVTDAKLSFLS